MGVGAFIGKIFGSEKAIDTVVEKVSSGLDKLVYTDEEKANAAAKDRADARAMVVQWMEHTSGQNLARRMLAMIVTVPWAFSFILSKIVACIGIFYKAKEMTELSTVLRSGMEDMNGPVMLVLAFYFAAPHMGTFTEAIVERFKKNV